MKDSGQVQKYCLYLCINEGLPAMSQDNSPVLVLSRVLSSCVGEQSKIY